MKVVELLRIGSELLKVMSENDVKRDDYQFVKMYHEYLNMRKTGIKYRVVIQMLAEEYHTSSASIERAIRRLGKEC
jgi:hypothetical protein